MSPLITKADILTYWPISLNLDDSRVNPYIVRAEEAFLQPLISPELYYALTEAEIVIGDRFDKLLNGDTYKDGSNYERKYVGLKPLIAAYAYSLIVDNNAVHVTRGGVNRKTGDNTENLTTGETGYKSSGAYSEAIRLEGQFYDYMSQRSGVYPEWGLGGNGPAKNSAFNFFNASNGRIRYGF